MAYRDDLEAAQARADAAERRARDLQKRVDELEQPEREPVAIPPGIEVIHGHDALRIRRRWFRASQHVPMMLFCVIWDGVLAAWITRSIINGSWWALVFGSAHLAVGIVMTYSLFAGLLNWTTITAGAERLEIRHGPVPWSGNRAVPRGDLLQLVVRARGRDGALFDLRAQVRGGAEVILIKGLADRVHADYLEHELERILRIRDRPVKSES